MSFGNEIVATGAPAMAFAAFDENVGLTRSLEGAHRRKKFTLTIGDGLCHQIEPLRL